MNIKRLISLVFLFKICHCINNETYHFNPCINIDSILETFSFDEPHSYNITIILKDIIEDYNRIKIKLKYDSLTNTTVPKKVFAFFFDDSYSFEGSLPYGKKPESITFTIAPFPGQPIPNLINFTVNNIEICKDGVYKDIWTNFLIAPTTTTQKSSKNINDNNEICGIKPAPFASFIHYGSSSKQGDWPWHSALYKLDTSGSQSKYICGATLVTNVRVLTAGHCVTEQGSVVSRERLYVTFGKFNFIGDDDGLQEKRVFDIALHPEFSRKTLTNDIAIIKLATEILITNYVRPICLNLDENRKKSDFFGKSGYVVGWGATEGSSHPTHLVEASMPLRSDAECLKKDPSFFGIFLNDGNFCAGFENGTNVCNGDSGGGFYLKDENDGKSWSLLGIISLGASLPNRAVCNPKHYVIFTNVLYYVDFLVLHL